MSVTSARTTLLGPLTTTWTPPASCSIAIAACSTCSSGWQAQTCYSDDLLSDEPSCWPPRAATAPSKEAPLLGWGIYSPGLACPVGYSTACSFDGPKDTGDFNFIFQPQTMETAIGCCPAGYKCWLPPGFTGQTCMAVMTSATVPTATCESGVSAHFSFQTVPFAIFQNTATQFVLTYTAYAPLFQLNYKEEDSVRAITTITTMMSPSAQDISIMSSPPSSQSFAQSTSQKSSESTLQPDSQQVNNAQSMQQGLSAGVTAGIGIGAALGTILLAVLLICLHRSRKTKAPRTPISSEGQRHIQHGSSILLQSLPSELMSVSVEPPKVELDGFQMSELEAWRSTD